MSQQFVVMRVCQLVCPSRSVVCACVKKNTMTHHLSDSVRLHLFVHEAECVQASKLIITELCFIRYHPSDEYSQIKPIINGELKQACECVHRVLNVCRLSH